MQKQNIEEKYKTALRDIPSPGSGAHPALLGCANLGVLSGMSQEDIFADIRESVPPGSREIPDSEIIEAIDKAVSDQTKQAGQPSRGIYVSLRGHRSGQGAVSKAKAEAERQAEHVQAIIDEIPDAPIESIRPRSPVQPTGDRSKDAELLLTRLYRPDELIWIGDRFDAYRPEKPSVWIKNIKRGIDYPHIIANPLSGNQHLSATNKLSYRCDKAVVAHRFALVEFDDLTPEQQAGRIAWMLDQGWPVAAVIHSGGKSLHAWLRFDVPDAATWKEKIYNGLYPDYLIPLGADPACKNAARLSRLAGVKRQDTKQPQRLVYLNPDAGTSTPDESVPVDESENPETGKDTSGSSGQMLVIDTTHVPDGVL